MALSVEQRWSVVVVAVVLVASASAPRAVVAQLFDSTFPKAFATVTPSTFEDFERDFDVYWGPEHVETTSAGNMLNLILTNDSGESCVLRETDRVHFLVAYTAVAFDLGW